MNTSATTDGVAEELRSILASRYGPPVDLDGPVVADEGGFDSAIHFVRYRGRSLPEPWRRDLVIRVKSRPDAIDDARFEADIQRWLVAHGFPAPAILELFDVGELTDRPAQVMERAPGTTMFATFRRAPWSVPGRLDTLAALQAQLHGLDPAGFPESIDVVERRLRLPRRMAETSDDAQFHDALAAVESLVPRLHDAPPSVCHGDFHPLNVVVDGAEASVIDWTDAGIGDRHGDICRTLLLFDLAAVAASGRVERAALRLLGPRMRGAYQRRYAAHREIDPDRIALWTPVHLLHAWAQTIGVDNDAFGDGGAVAERLPDGLQDELRGRYHAAMAGVRPPRSSP